MAKFSGLVSMNDGGLYSVQEVKGLVVYSDRSFL